MDDDNEYIDSDWNEQDLAEAALLMDEVNFMRSSKRKKMPNISSNDNMDIDVLSDSSSDFGFQIEDFNSSDSEWSENEERVLTNKRQTDDQSSSDEDIPLSLYRQARYPEIGESSRQLNKPDRCVKDLEESGLQSAATHCKAILDYVLDRVVSHSKMSASVLNGCGLNESEVDSNGESSILSISGESGLDTSIRSGSSVSVMSSESGSLTNKPNPSERGRKRKADVENWERNKMKRAVNEGRGYVTKKGKVIERKRMKPGCGANCQKKCHQKFNDQARENIFHEFWRMGDLSKKRFFINRIVKRTKTSTHTTTDSRRKYTLQWHLPGQNLNELVPVCKLFFLSTMAISDQMVITALNKYEQNPIEQPDNRGGSNIDTVSRQEVKDHIESFPVVDSHYCRKNTKRQYLGKHLNISMMYRMYEQKMKTEGKNSMCKTSYENIFNYQYNLGFHRPLKDLCDECQQYENSSEEERALLKPKREQHLSDHKDVNEIKEEHKTRSKNDEAFEAFVFDLEEVLLTPKLGASMWYYKRKLCTYNLSWYELGSSKATCHVWNENQAGRGSNEVASCMYSTLEEASQRNVKHVALYSDSCGGQNKNRNFVTMLWLAVNRFPIEEIEHLFFVRGHSKNENDSVHSSIEHASRKIDVHTTPQWATIMRTARHTSPLLNVKELDTEDFYDFKKCASKIINFDLDSDGNRVRWLDIKKFKLGKSNPQHFMFSYSVKGDFKKVNLMVRPRKTIVVDPIEVPLEVINGGKRCGIDKDKKRDLLCLCEKKLIPSVHHAFFNNLHVSN